MKTRSAGSIFLSVLFLMAGKIFAWEAKVFEVKGKKVTIATRQSAGIGLGARLYILNKGKPIGQGRVTGVFHTKVELALSSGSAQKDCIATDKLLGGIASIQPAAAPKALNPNKWISRKIPKASTWNSIAYGNGVFVMLPYGEASETLVSTDGIRWTLHKLPASEGNWVLTFGNGIFVAFSGIGKKDAQGQITAFVGMSMTSTDGKKWTYTEIPKLGHNWYEIIYGNGIFLASGGGYTSAGDSLDVFARSSDGKDWQVSERKGDGRHLVIGGNGMFAALNARIAEVGVSVDGQEWRFQKLEAKITGYERLIFGNGTFAILGSLGAPLVSANGSEWTVSPKVPNASWKQIIFYGDKFMGVSANQFGYSADGFDWTKVQLPSQHDHHAKIACGNKRCVIQRYGADHVLTTP